MIIRKLRLQKGWSQEQLAQLSAISVRTIQRIERGQSVGLESMKCLAAVFEIDIADLSAKSNTEEQDMNNQGIANHTRIDHEEAQALQHVRDIKGFYTHLIKYAIIVGALFILNLVTSPGYIWAWWVAMGWGIGVASHGLSVFEVFDFFGPKWERRQVEKKLGKKL
jgi:transcriptional regulator with XRE-family HTH domain